MKTLKYAMGHLAAASVTGTKNKISHKSVVFRMKRASQADALIVCMGMAADNLLLAHPHSRDSLCVVNGREDGKI